MYPIHFNILPAAPYWFYLVICWTVDSYETVYRLKTLSFYYSECFDNLHSIVLSPMLHKCWKVKKHKEKKNISRITFPYDLWSWCSFRPHTLSWKTSCSRWIVFFHDIPGCTPCYFVQVPIGYCLVLKWDGDGWLPAPHTAALLFFILLKWEGTRWTHRCWRKTYLSFSFQKRALPISFFALGRKVVKLTRNRANCSLKKRSGEAPPCQFCLAMLCGHSGWKSIFYKK